MEQVIFLRKKTRLAILCLMLDCYNNDIAKYYSKNIEFGFIKKCANEFNFLENIGNIINFDINQAYFILRHENNTVRQLLVKLLGYQAFCRISYNIAYGKEGINYTKKILNNVDSSLSLDDYIKDNPLSNTVSPILKIYNIDDPCAEETNQKKEDLLYKDL